MVQFTNILPKYLTISRRRRREYRRIFSSPEETNCFSIITLMIIRENKIKNRQMFERFWGCKMSVEGGSDRQQAGFLIIAAVGFPHGNVRFCQTFISFIDFHVFYLICELLLLLKTFCRKKKYFAKVMKSCRHFEAKKCKETYQFSVNCATCKREILSTYLRIVSLQICSINVIILKTVRPNLVGV